MGRRTRSGRQRALAHVSPASLNTVTISCASDRRIQARQSRLRRPHRVPGRHTPAGSTRLCARPVPHHPCHGSAVAQSAWSWTCIDLIAAWSTDAGHAAVLPAHWRSRRRSRARQPKRTRGGPSLRQRHQDEPGPLGLMSTRPCACALTASHPPLSIVFVAPPCLVLSLFPLFPPLS